MPRGRPVNSLSNSGTEDRLETFSRSSRDCSHELVELPVDVHDRAADAFGDEAHDLAPPGAGVVDRDVEHEVGVVAGQDRAAFGEQQRLQRGRPYLLRFLGFRDAALSLFALASLAGGRVDLEVPRDGVVEDGGEGRPGFPGGAALVAAGDQFLLPRGDVVCFDLDQLGVAEPGPPDVKITGADVWAVLEAAEGRCEHCRSLAVENRPSAPDGKPLPWAPVGRRIGSLGHRVARFNGGSNAPGNLAWACLWCNTWQSERRPGATGHGGIQPLHK